jgi:hypothetical protein
MSRRSRMRQRLRNSPARQVRRRRHRPADQRVRADARFALGRDALVSIWGAPSQGTGTPTKSWKDLVTIRKWWQ